MKKTIFNILAGLGLAIGSLGLIKIPRQPISFLFAGIALVGLFYFVVTLSGARQE